MIKLISFFIIFNLATGCSFNSNSEFWTSSKDITQENANYKKILKNQKRTVNKEFNSNLKINLGTSYNKNLHKSKQLNNIGRIEYDGQLKKISRYKFSNPTDLTEIQYKKHHFKNQTLLKKGNTLYWNPTSFLNQTGYTLTQTKTHLTLTYNGYTYTLPFNSRKWTGATSKGSWTTLAQAPILFENKTLLVPFSSFIQFLDYSLFHNFISHNNRDEFLHVCSELFGRESHKKERRTMAHN